MAAATTKVSTPDTWVKVSDSMVRHLWQCPECKAKVSVGPAAYADIGVPFCSDCDTARVYVGTEFNLGAYLRRTVGRLSLDRLLNAEAKDLCPVCGYKWDDHDFGVPRPMCPAPARPGKSWGTPNGEGQQG